MLLRLAIRDSLGNTSEGMAPAERRDLHRREQDDGHVQLLTEGAVETFVG